MRPVYGNLLGDLKQVRSLGTAVGESYVDKDLRTILARRCGASSTSATAGRGT